MLWSSTAGQQCLGIGEVNASWMADDQEEQVKGCNASARASHQIACVVHLSFALCEEQEGAAFRPQI